MRGQAIILEHVMLAVASLLILVLVAVVFGEVGRKIQDDQTEAVLSVMAEETASAIVRLHSLGQGLNASTQPAVVLKLDFPPSIGGSDYVIFYSEVDGKVVSMSRGKRAEVELPPGKPVDSTIEGKISSSFSKKASLSYYTGQNRIVLGLT